MAVTRNNSPVDEHRAEGVDQDEDQEVFTVNGRPVYFYLYGTNEPDSSWALTEGQREELAELIERHGGLLTKSIKDADTILTSIVGYEPLKSIYNFERTQYVEKPAFIYNCIAKRRYEHDRIQKRPLGGRPPGRSRENFTPEDDYNLCKFLALHVPEKDAGGRTGIKLYIELVEKAQYEYLDYQWAARHPPDSWRGRYKNNQARFDQDIDELVKQNPPPADGKGVRPYDRRVNRSSIFARIAAQEEEEEQHHEQLGQEQHVYDLRPQYARPRWTYPGVGLQHSASPVEQRRGRTHSVPHGRIPEQDDPFDDLGEFRDDMEHEGWREDDDGARPGPEDAGPSGTQRTPQPSPPPVQPVQKRAAQQPSARPHERVVAAKERPMGRTRAAASQIPASSQATLVGPVPTQLRGTSAAARPPASQARRPAADEEEGEEPAPAEKQPRKRRKLLPPPEPPVAVLEPLREAGLGSRTASQRAQPKGPGRFARKTAQPPPQVIPPRPDTPEEEDGEMRSDEEEEERHSSGEDDIVDDQEAPIVGPTLEDEQDVEQLLQGSVEDSAVVSRDGDRSFVSASEEIESDDQRARAKLLPLRARLPAGPARTGSHASMRQQDIESRLHEVSDDESFAEALDLTGPAPRSRAASAAHAEPGLAPVTPVRGGALRREGTDGSSTSSNAPGVPLPNTRASAVKERQRESRRHEVYIPPPNTKAAEAIKVASEGKLKLRSRAVERRRF